MRHRRNAPRFPGFDYRHPGAYFITICTRRRDRILGVVADGSVRLSPMGAIVQAVWRSIPHHHRCVGLDAFVIMPDHLHGILVFESQVRSLAEIVGLFKAASSREINRARESPGGVVWQRSFHDRIIRNDQALWSIRRYIDENPRKWVE